MSLLCERQTFDARERRPPYPTDVAAAPTGVPMVPRKATKPTIRGWGPYDRFHAAEQDERCFPEAGTGARSAKHAPLR